MVSPKVKTSTLWRLSIIKRPCPRIQWWFLSSPCPCLELSLSWTCLMVPLDRSYHIVRNNNQWVQWVSEFQQTLITVSLHQWWNRYTKFLQCIKDKWATRSWMPEILNLNSLVSEMWMRYKSITMLFWLLNVVTSLSFKVKFSSVHLSHPTFATSL